MLDRLFESQFAAVAFIFFIIVLVGIYLVNRERAQVQRLRGPKRFSPKWRDRGGGRKKSRRRRRPGGFTPGWTERETDAEGGSTESREDDATDEDTPSAG